MRKVIGLMLAVVMVLGSQALAQPKDPPPKEGDQARPAGDRRGRDRDRPRNREEWEKRMQEFRKRMDDRMRESFGASEEEWKVLKPRIDKVRELQRQGRGGFRGGFMFGSGRGRGRRPGGDSRGRPEGAPEREQSQVEKKTQALRSMLEDKAAGAQAIKAALTALRKAREQSAAQLAAAQKSLREVLTMRQEAQCVLMGLLP